MYHKSQQFQYFSHLMMNTFIFMLTVYLTFFYQNSNQFESFTNLIWKNEKLRRKNIKFLLIWQECMIFSFKDSKLFFPSFYCKSIKWALRFYDLIFIFNKLRWNFRRNMMTMNLCHFSRLPLSSPSEQCFANNQTLNLCLMLFYRRLLWFYDGCFRFWLTSLLKWTNLSLAFEWIICMRR